MGIRHSKVSAAAIPANPTKVNSADWNDDHVIDDRSLPLAKLATTDAVPEGATHFLRSDGQWASLDGLGGETVLVGYVNAANIVYGAIGDGDSARAEANRVALTSAMSAASASGISTVFVPPGTYYIARNGTSSYSLDIPADGVRLVGAGKGKTVFRHPPGMPDASVSLIRCNNRSNVTIEGIELDGHWGNAVTRISTASQRVSLASAPGVINVLSTTGFPSSGSLTVVCEEGATTVTYTGITATSFTGVVGGTGTLTDGNNVGYVDAITGINHTSQADPKNYGIFLRGSHNTRILDCSFKNIYGDAIWIGSESNNPRLWSTNTRIHNCDMDIIARNGITFGAGCSDTKVYGTRITNVYSQAVDFEPQTDFSGCVDVTITDSLLGQWFVPHTHPGYVALSLVGSVTVNPSASSMARNIRITNCTVLGPTVIQNTKDVSLRGCRLICDWGGQSTAPLLVQMQNENLRLIDCFVYDRTSNGGTANRGAISIQQYSAGLQPTSVIVDSCFVHAKNGRHGIVIEGTGGRAFDTTYQSPVSGTATSTGDTAMADTGAAWVTNQWVGWKVRIGSAVASIKSNTATALVLGDGSGLVATYAWANPNTGALVATPAAGAYTIFQETGFLVVRNTEIDCGNDGYGAGGNGVWLYNENPGMRVVLDDVRVKNATGGGIHVKSAAAAGRIYRVLEIRNAKAWDDQVTPTCTAVVHFENTPNISKFILANNTASDGVPAVYTGLTTGVWLNQVGMSEGWEGYGVPAHAAPNGSRYFRVDGTGPNLYVRENGAWVAK